MYRTLPVPYTDNHNQFQQQQQNKTDYSCFYARIFTFSTCVLVRLLYLLLLHATVYFLLTGYFILLVVILARTENCVLSIPLV